MVLSAPSLIEGHRSLVVSCRGEVIAVMFFEKDARPHFGLKESRIGVVSNRVQVLVQLLVLRLPLLVEDWVAKYEKRSIHCRRVEWYRYSTGTGSGVCGDAHRHPTYSLIFASFRGFPANRQSREFVR